MQSSFLDEVKMLIYGITAPSVEYKQASGFSIYNAIEDFIDDTYEEYTLADIEDTGCDEVAVSLKYERDYNHRTFKLHNRSKGTYQKFMSEIYSDNDNPDLAVATTTLFEKFGVKSKVANWFLLDGCTMGSIQVLKFRVEVLDKEGSVYVHRFTILSNMGEEGDFRVFDTITGRLIVDARESFAHCNSRFMLVQSDSVVKDIAITSIGFLIRYFRSFMYN